MTPLLFRWQGDSFEPLRPKLADKQYVVGAVYNLVPVEERSTASHNQFFASVSEAFNNLPEDQAERFKSSEHLRKWALIQAGFRDERSIVCSSHAEALRLAAFIEPMDDYAVVMVAGAAVRVYTARSQSYKAMPKGEFQRSKDAVLDVLAKLLGVTVDDLKKAEAA